VFVVLALLFCTGCPPVPVLTNIMYEKLAIKITARIPTMSAFFLLLGFLFGIKIPNTVLESLFT
jgi:hypothetical protein